MSCRPRANDPKNTAQLAVDPPPDSEQRVGLKLPAPLLAKLTVPLGVVLAPPAVSVTTAVHAVTSPGANTHGEQLTLVVVACGAAGLVPVISYPPETAVHWSFDGQATLDSPWNSKTGAGAGVPGDAGLNVTALPNESTTVHWLVDGHA